ncbi:hypothetical protein ACFC09_34945 [Streptomyces sp. NPDC056161]|uniref:hypothetical protein n=1 Tax=Streptomyces sp. NPDC056161 TaxID=3345732 RepID=UPI0035E12DB6
MHRTTTAAALLVTVAVSALSGCVTVQRPPAARPPGTAPAQPPGPRPDGTTEPRVVQAPAREALEMVGPSRRPERPERPGRPGRPGRPEPAAPSGPAEAPAPRQPPPRTRPRPQPHREPAQPPRTEVPAPSGPAPAASDVCALGKRYGGWRADSPESRICRQAYGR